MYENAATNPEDETQNKNIIIILKFQLKSRIVEKRINMETKDMKHT